MALVVGIDSQAEPSSRTLRRWDVEADGVVVWCRRCRDRGFGEGKVVPFLPTGRHEEYE